MKSVTKFIATNEQIRGAFRAAGIGEITGIKELSDGWFSSIFSAADFNGKRYVIKIAPPKDAPVLAHERNMMRSEVDFYRLLKEKTEVRTPQIIFADFSESVIPTPYFIMEYLDGVRLDKAKLTPEDKRKVTEKIAFILSEFHKIKGDGYGYKQAGLKDNLKDGLIYMTRMLIDDCAAFGKKCKIGEKLLRYIERFSAVLENVPSVLVNFEFC